MQEKIKAYWTKGLEYWKATKKRTKLLAGGGVLAVLLVIAVVVAAGMNQPYVALFTRLNQSDMTAIVNFLSESGVTDYRIDNNDTILVPENQVDYLRAQVFTQGYPKSGFAYDTYFENVGSLTTESERAQVTLYALQDRMAATIRQMDGVREATVNITPAEDHTYVLDSQNSMKAKASVMVTMEDGKLLSDNQVQAIKNVLSHSVPWLDIEEVAVTDTYGNNYSVQDALGNVQDLSQLKFQLEQQVNNTIRTHVMEVLVPLYGVENVRVSVNSIVNVDRTYTDKVDYELGDWAADGSTGGRGIIGQEIYSHEIIRDPEDEVGGVAGTDANADIPVYPGDPPATNGNESLVSNSGETNYLVPTTNTQTEHIAGTVSDVMVSVTINENVAGQTAAADLYSHVGRAAGISADMQDEKINILIAPFYTENNTVPIPGGSLELEPWMLYAALGGLVVFIVLLVVILLIRKRRKKKKQAALLQAQGLLPEQPDQAVAVAAAQGADIMEMETEKSMELRKDVRKFAEDNPEIAAQMVKHWLKEGEDNA